MYVLYTIRADWASIVFITEITARAFIVADANKRRTLSRADIAKALGRSDQFDFLIDVVPRDEVVFSERGQSNQGQGSTSGSLSGANAEDANEVP
jgi:nuclear transcription factor Y gamma